MLTFCAKINRGLGRLRSRAQEEPGADVFGAVLPRLLQMIVCTQVAGVSIYLTVSYGSFVSSPNLCRSLPSMPPPPTPSLSF